MCAYMDFSHNIIIICCACVCVHASLLCSCFFVGAVVYNSKHKADCVCARTDFSYGIITTCYVIVCMCAYVRACVRVYTCFLVCVCGVGAVVYV